MPSKKVLVSIIICGAAVVSVWLVASKKTNIPATSHGGMVESVSGGALNADDWKNILLSVDNGLPTETASSTSSAGAYPNEGTLTDQMAKDFLAQYLSLKQGGATVSAEEANQIAQNIISSPAYTNASGPVYTVSNLHVTNKTDKDTVEQYMNDGLALLSKYSNSSYQNELVILKQAVQDKNPSELSKLDPIIANYRALIAGALDITVPKDAVEYQLALLNAISNVLSNVEAMRVTFTDPVRSFAGVSQYKQHAADVSIAMNKLGDYFRSKGVSK